MEAAFKHELVAALLNAKQHAHVEDGIKDYYDDSRGLLFCQLKSKERSNFLSC